MERGACLSDASADLQSELESLVAQVATNVENSLVEAAHGAFREHLEAQCALERLQSEGGTEASINEGKCRVSLLEAQVMRTRDLIASIAGSPAVD